MYNIVHAYNYMVKQHTVSQIHTLTTACIHTIPTNTNTYTHSVANILLVYKTALKN